MFLRPTTEELGVFEATVELLRPAPHGRGAALVQLASRVRIAVVGFTLASGHNHVRGRLIYEGHVGPEGVELEEVACRGMVRRVRSVPMVGAASAGAPLDVRSTIERRRDGFRSDQLLVDLEINADPDS